MFQVVQDVARRKVLVSQVPDPVVRPGHVLIANTCSVISAGTERSVTRLANKSLLGKARARPDLVRQVLRKLKTEGLARTLDQVSAKLKEPVALGYSSAGVVLAAGQGVESLKPGDRVASNGPHAGIVCVPQHLCARIPEEVDQVEAAFTILACIALQGVRLAELGLGESALVIGLGLVGQLTVALLKAQGCRVLGTDLAAGRARLALQMGADRAETELEAGLIRDFTGADGFDAVLVAASTPSAAPLELAGEAVRKKGRVVVIGAVGMTLPRQSYYLKEAELVVSCSYGPGRYDPSYEERGRDYPAAYVRWTEQRNMTAVLELMRRGQLLTRPLISRRYSVEQAEEAYKLLDEASEDCLGIVLEYPELPPQKRVTLAHRPTSGRSELGVACLGTGQFARLVMLPILGRLKGVRPVMLCSAGGLSARYAGESHGFEEVTADEDEVFRDPRVDAVLIFTRHNQHAAQVVKALEAGKHVFVEKPLALSLEEVLAVETALAERPHLCLTVGFNRRFAPLARETRNFFADLRSPLTCSVRFNAGYLSADHWTQEEGGRLLGEACHAIDLASFLVGSPPERVFAESAGADDQALMLLRHRSGSTSQIAYLAGGSPSFEKERVELTGGGRMAVIEDFRSARFSDGRTSKSSQDKGHRAELSAFVAGLMQGGPPPIPFEEIRATSLAALAAVQSLREGVPLPVEPD
ncbi:MAG: oxidoreductase [Candidatus Xenobia bacterium]